jgi:hypothetical protein
VDPSSFFSCQDFIVWFMFVDQGIFQVETVDKVGETVIVHRVRSHKLMSLTRMIGSSGTDSVMHLVHLLVVMQAVSPAR